MVNKLPQNILWNGPIQRFFQSVFFKVYFCEVYLALRILLDLRVYLLSI